MVEKSRSSRARGEQRKQRIKSVERKISGTSSLSGGQKIKGRRHGDKWLVVDQLSDSGIGRAFLSCERRESFHVLSMFVPVGCGIYVLDDQASSLL